MRAHEYLFESDQRTTLDKLKAVIDHPATEATVRAVAQSKYDLLLQQQVEEEQEIVNRFLVPTNISPESLEQQYILGVTVGDIYDSLCGLLPRPSNIQFSKIGTIHIMVPPPYHGLTKAQFMQLIMTTVPGVKAVRGGESILDKFYNPLGYAFSLHFI